MNKELNSTGAIVIILLIAMVLGFGVYKYADSKLKSETKTNNSSNVAETRVNNSTTKTDKKEKVVQTYNIVGIYQYLEKYEEIGESKWTEFTFNQDGTIQQVEGGSSSGGSLYKGTYKINDKTIVMTLRGQSEMDGTDEFTTTCTIISESKISCGAFDGENHEFNKINESESHPM